MSKLFLSFLLVALTIAPAFPQNSTASPDIKSVILKHLKTSEDFSAKVAEAMPAENYDFKLTAEQMSFGGQMTHLSQALGYFTSAFTGEKPGGKKPASNSKTDVISFMKASYEAAEAQVEKLTPEQMAKSYSVGQGKSESGYEILLGMLDHCTNHRASAEMYLRVKGITPPQYEF